MSKLRE